MNEIRIIIDGRESAYNAPSCFDEMRREQLLALCRMNRNGDETDFYAAMSGIDAETWNSIPFEQRYHVKRLFDFAFTRSPEISRQLLPYIEAGGVRMIGFQPNFSNTTWEEFIYADGYMLAGKFRQAAAVLYRPQREDYNGETDRRIPFSIYGTDTRMKLFEDVGEDQLLAFLLCYKSLRKRNLEDKYPNVFARRPRKPKTSPNQQTPAFSWVSVHRDIMGDQFYDEGKFFASNVHVILGRLDRVIREGRRY